MVQPIASAATATGRATMYIVCQVQAPHSSLRPAPQACATKVCVTLAMPRKKPKAVQTQTEAKPVAASSVAPSRPTRAASITPIAVIESWLRTAGIARSTTSRTLPRWVASCSAVAVASGRLSVRPRCPSGGRRCAGRETGTRIARSGSADLRQEAIERHTDEHENFASDLDEIAREGARRMLAQAFEAEVADYICA